MPTIHLTLDGDFEECVTSDCELKFHFPDTTSDEMRHVPMRQLVQLTEIADPPLQVDSGKRVWLDAHGLLHRDYGLPALIYFWGTAVWYTHGHNQKKRLSKASRQITAYEDWRCDAIRRIGEQKYRVLDHAQTRYLTMIGAAEVQA